MIYKVWEGEVPQGLAVIPKEVQNFVDKQGWYQKNLTNKGGFIAVFGANAQHLTDCAKGQHFGGGQAAGVVNCKNVMPLDTMSALSDSEYRNKLFATIRYQFAEMLKRPNTPFVIPSIVLTQTLLDDFKSTSKMKNWNARNDVPSQRRGLIQQWLDSLGVNSPMVNMGGIGTNSICTTPDIEVLYEINTRMSEAIRKQRVMKGAQDASEVQKQIQSWKDEVLPNVAKIATGEISPDSVDNDGLMDIPPQKGSGNTVAKDDVTKFKTVLQKIRTQNKDLAKLSVDKVLEIFHDASENKYYTNRKPQLPLDVSGNSRTDKDAVLMRKFSVEFQRECNTQGLNFSDRGQNENGMRTKSVMGFLKKNNGGDIQKLLKAEWERK